MSASGTIERFTTALIESAASRGFDAQAVLRCDRAPADGRWDGEHLLTALRRVGVLLDDEFYGLAAKPCPAGTAQLGIEMMILSPTLRDGIDRCSRLYGLVTSCVGLRLVEDGDVATFKIDVADPRLDPWHFLPEWHAVRWYKFFQWCTRERIPLLGVDFAHPAQTAPAEYEHLFGVECRFNRLQTGLSFPRRVLDRAVTRTLADLQSALSLSSYNPEASEHLDSAWRHDLKTFLKGRLSRDGMIPTLEEIAEAFGVCSQTLRRRLKAENYSYRALKAETRRDVALEGMRDRRLTLAQISLMAGFAETNGLVRAVRGWTGMTPSELRRAAVGDAAASSPSAGERRRPVARAFREDASGPVSGRSAH